MRIGVNLTFVLNDNMNFGLGKHAQDILLGFREMGVLKDCILFVVNPFYDAAIELFPEATIGLVRIPRLISALPRFKGKGFLTERLIQKIIFPAAARRYSMDLVLHTFNNKATMHIRNVPNIIVIHDLFYLHYTKKKYYYRLVNHAHEYFIRSMEHIVVLSQEGRRELMDHFGSDCAHKLHIIPNAVTIRENLRWEPDTNQPYLLYVAAQAVHKNHLTLLEAFNSIREYIPHKLILLGAKREETRRIHQFIDRHHLQDRVTCIEENVTDEYRDRLYRGASLFLSPSLYEGFGRPAIEAALMEAPVLVNDIPVLNEVTFGRLRYYSPGQSPGALATAILDLLKNIPTPEERADTAALLREMYSPLKIARAYYDVLQEAVNEYVR